MKEEILARIRPLRKRIDALDEKLVEILNERAHCAVKIGQIKRSVGQAVYDAEREAAILARVTSEEKGPLSAAARRRLFERILDESRSLERTAHGSENAKNSRRT